MRKLLFKDFITLQRGFDLPRKDMVEGPYPVVGSTSIIGWHNEFKKNQPGVVTGRSGSLGYVLYRGKGTPTPETNSHLDLSLASFDPDF